MAAPDENIRMEPAKKGSEKLRSARNGTAEDINTENTKTVSEKDLFTAVMSSVNRRHAARMKGVSLI